MLTAAGHQVVWLVEASTAMEQIRLLHPVAIIMDMQSLDKDSHHLIHQLGKLNNRKQTKLVLITTQNTLTDEKKVVAGADACLIKPVDPERLIYELDRLLGSIREGLSTTQVDNVGLK